MKEKLTLFNALSVFKNSVHVTYYYWSNIELNI